jgi:hypothetical protein
MIKKWLFKKHLDRIKELEDKNRSLLMNQTTYSMQMLGLANRILKEAEDYKHVADQRVAQIKTQLELATKIKFELPSGNDLNKLIEFAKRWGVSVKIFYSEADDTFEIETIGSSSWTNYYEKRSNVDGFIHRFKCNFDEQKQKGNL